MGPRVTHAFVTWLKPLVSVSKVNQLQRKKFKKRVAVPVGYQFTLPVPVPANSNRNRNSGRFLLAYLGLYSFYAFSPRASQAISHRTKKIWVVWLPPEIGKGLNYSCYYRYLHCNSPCQHWSTEEPGDQRISIGPCSYSRGIISWRYFGNTTFVDVIVAWYKLSYVKNT